MLILYLGIQMLYYVHNIYSHHHQFIYRHRISDSIFVGSKERPIRRRLHTIGSYLIRQ